ncbi:site-specific integrase [Telluria aromaticivorans]|uniref:Tyrosine-type recombinase/integrase n=1 Tax=Telluria aromaticivorans TaxID=2725995 RepID=A0A7Y2JXL0_9BURK|nr:site-specific integrase [Telluria aromaticivorans]NNG22891.1 tyrosine-type recombinase/integrase [Telluria aromaticivorans]
MPLFSLSPIVSLKLKHIWKKPNSSLLYYRRRIPEDLKPLLEAAGSEWAGKSQIVISLQTSDPKTAAPKIVKLTAQHDKEWEELRNPSKVGTLAQAETLLRNRGIDPAAPNEDEQALSHFFDIVEDSLPRRVKDNLQEAYEQDYATSPKRDIDLHLSPVVATALQIVQGRREFTLSDCLDQYVTSRSEKAAKTAKIAFGYLRDFFKEDRGLASIRRQDVNDFVKWLLAGEHNKDGKTITTTTVARYLNSIIAAVGRAIKENELDIKNQFSSVEIPNAGKDAQERLPFELSQLKTLHRVVDEWVSAKGWDQPRCIITVLAETGCRLAEVTGLASADVHLDTEPPYIDLMEHPWRSLKNDKASVRKVPLTPRAIEAIKAAQGLSKGSKFLFPRYTTVDKCNINTVSATLIKWLRSRNGFENAKVDNHSLRHSMKDRLRAVQCPDSIQDQILGHTTRGVGAGYGQGYPLAVLAEWVKKAMAAVWA